MTHFFKYTALFFFVAILSGCAGKTPEIKGFDPLVWRADKNGCQGKRAGLIDAVQAGKESLKGMSQNEILGFLGKPDAREVYNRGQRFYVYFLEKGGQCLEQKTKDRGRALILRFSAVDKLSEINIGDY